MISWYSHHIYPRLMDLVLGREGPLRKEALKTAHGSVLEVGFGTGLNLPHYPLQVTQLLTLDIEELLPGRVKKRICAVPFSVQQTIVEPDKPFPFADGYFDCVVTTWTLCSVTDVRGLLREIRRVLRPDGDYLFLEHGLAFDDVTARRQRRLNWASRLLANGCRLDTRIPAVLNESGLSVTRLNRFLNHRAIRLAGYMYQGVAKKGSAHNIPHAAHQ